MLFCKRLRWCLWTPPCASLILWPLTLQVVMTIIVAFILDAFVFRMNYSRKNREPLEKPEGGMDFIRFQLVCLVKAETWRSLECVCMLTVGGGLFSVTCCEAATNLFFPPPSLCNCRWERHCVWSRGESWWSSGLSGILQTHLSRTILHQLSARCPPSHGQRRGKIMQSGLHSLHETST